MQRIRKRWPWNSNAAATSESATLQALRHALGGHCPGCDETVSQHRIVQLGLTVATAETSQRVRELIDSFRSQSWDKVTQFREFDGGCDALEVFAINCPLGKNSVILVRDPEELYDSKAVLESQVVAEYSWLFLSEAAIEKEWMTFQ